MSDKEKEDQQTSDEWIKELIANAEQAQASMKELAHVAASYYFQLIEEGIPPAHAVILTQSMQAAIIHLGKTNG